MLVILKERQIISTKQVCSSCLMANSSGLPRWHQGQISCARPISSGGKLSESCGNTCAQIYECQMGFHLANIK